MNNETIDNAISRVARNEELMSKIAEVISSDNYSAKKLLDVQSALEQLKKYYDSLDWMNDYERDEAGLFPGDLKRGVLSEDGIDHLFDDAKEWASQVILRLSEKQILIMDILPWRVPEKGGGQFFEIEKFFLSEPNVYDIRLKYADIILKINCYYQIMVNNSDSPFWDSHPDPGTLSGWIMNNSSDQPVLIIVPEEETLIVINNDDLHMTVHGASGKLLELIRELCRAEGVFIRESEMN